MLRVYNVSIVPLLRTEKERADAREPRDTDRESGHQSVQSAHDQQAARDRRLDERERGQEQRERLLDERQHGQDQRERELDERERLREMFVAVLGHDLRTPLSTVKTAATGLLKCSTLSVADASAVGRIERAAARMETMVSQLLDFTRARLGGGFQIDRSRFDIVLLISELLEESWVLHPDREVRCELPASAEGSFDRNKVAQVISNLLQNAFEYAPAGTPITITLREQADSISVEVTNGGPAVPDEVREHLFDPFRRGRRATRHGLGLGLFISREVAAAHGGAVTFTSTEGETRFTLRLPRA